MDFHHSLTQLKYLANMQQAYLITGETSLAEDFKAAQASLQDKILSEIEALQEKAAMYESLCK